MNDTEVVDSFRLRSDEVGDGDAEDEGEADGDDPVADGGEAGDESDSGERDSGDASGAEQQTRHGSA